MSEFLGDILEEHLEEADFLYLQHKYALQDDDYVLGEVAELEERLLAHVDGLVVAGEEAWEMLSGKLAGDDEGEAFAAALVALASGDAGRREELLAALAKAHEDALPGLQAALCLFEARDLGDALREIVGEADTPVAAAIVDTLGFWRRGLSPDELGLILQSEEAPLRRAGLDAAAAMGWRDFAECAAEALDDDDHALRAAAVRCGFVLGDERPLRRVRELLAAGDAAAAELQIWLGVAGDPGDGTLLAQGLANGELARGAVIALGWLGDPGQVGALVSRLDDPALARQILQAIVRITGVDLQAEGLLADEPPAPAEAEEEEGKEDAPDEAADSDAVDEDDEDHEDDDFADPPEDPDEHLPWPDAGRLADWWQSAQGGFAAGKRLRGGREWDRSIVLAVLQHGGMQERHLAACELARLSPGEPLLETRALTWHQIRRMTRISAG